MIYWAPLLHFYQPPGQLHEVLRRVCDESYRALIQVFRDHPHARATFNINGVLTEMLWENGFDDVIEGLKELGENGQVEFVGSGKYHPILPLIPEEERKRQIQRNFVTNNYFLGDRYSPKGFFPPEMCYSADIVDSIAESGHQWVIISGVACPAPWPMNVIYEIEGKKGKLAVFFRDDILSNKISFHNIDGPGFISHLKGLQENGNGDVYVVTAQDAETFGHHIKDWETVFLAEVYDALGEDEPLATLSTLASSPQPKLAAAGQHRALFDYQVETEAKEIEAVTISQLLDRFPRTSVVEPRASSWSTTIEDIDAGNPYPLWNTPGHELHRLQWEHIQICLELLESAQRCADNDPSKNFAGIARVLMDRALHSCQFWWASRRPMWDINMINRGLMQQQEVVVNSYKSVEASGAPHSAKREGYYRVIASRDIRAKIVDQLFRG